jgi:hypothetical protein
MIKINLLDSITERQFGTAVVVERKVASPASKLLLMTIAVTGLLIAIIGWDIVSTTMAKADAEKELQNQQEIAKQLESVMKEQKELEAKITNIDTRISKAIRRMKRRSRSSVAVSNFRPGCFQISELKLSVKTSAVRPIRTRRNPRSLISRFAALTRRQKPAA